MEDLVTPPDLPADDTAASSAKPPLTPLRGTAAAAARALRKREASSPSWSSSSSDPALFTDNVPPTAEVMEKYAALKGDMLEASRKHGSMHFVRREKGNHCGLINQGATCYLNSLLQSLYMNRQFRKAVYGWAYEPAVHGADESACIPLQLQRLFGRLQLSSQGAVSTKGLTGAFGWSGADAFTQHDVQELTCVLFDALERSDPPRFKEINGLWKGSSVAFIQPKTLTDPSQRHERKEDFMDIQVPVAGMGTLEQGLRAVVAVETMEGDNKWFCDELGAKVDAVKGTSFARMPAILTLHLMRFQFDMRLLRRVKVHDGLSFPRAIDLSFLLDGGGKGGAAGAGAAVSEQSLEYELTSILIHSGSADRGHYYAFIREDRPHALQPRKLAPSPTDSADADAPTTTPPLSEWFCFNDSNVHRLDAREEDSIFTGHNAHGATAAAAASQSHLEAVKAEAGAGAVAVAGPGESPRDTDAAADGDADAAAGDKGAANGGGKAATESVVAAAHTSAANAYLLVYRRKATGEAAAAAAGVDAGVEVQGGGKDEEDEDVVVPAGLAAEVAAENAAWEALKQCHELHKEMVELIVYPPRAASGAAAPFAVSSIGGFGGGGGSGEGKDKDGRVVLQLHRSCSLADATRLAYDALVQREAAEAASSGDGGGGDGGDVAECGDSGGGGGDGEEDEDGAGKQPLKAATFSLAGCALSDCRLRRFSPHLRRAGATFGHVAHPEAATLAGGAGNTGLAPHAVLLLECRRDASVAWTEYNPNDMALKVVTWDSAASAPSQLLHDTFDVLVPGEGSASVGSCRAVVAQALGLICDAPRAAAILAAAAAAATAAAATSAAAVAATATASNDPAPDRSATPRARHDSERGDLVGAAEPAAAAEAAAAASSASVASGSHGSECAPPHSDGDDASVVAACRRVWLFKVADGEAALLEHDDRLLKKHFDVWPGDSLVVELAPPTAAGAPLLTAAAEAPAEVPAWAGEGGAPLPPQPLPVPAAPFESDVLATFEAAHNTVEILVNHPDRPDGPLLRVAAKRSESLAAVKRRAIDLLNASASAASADAASADSVAFALATATSAESVADATAATAEVATPGLGKEMATPVEESVPSVEAIAAATAVVSDALAAASAASAASATPSPPAAEGVLSEGAVTEGVLTEGAVTVRRGAKGALIKDEGKSLRALGLSGGSTLFLSRGRPCLPYEFLLDFVRYDPSAKAPFSALVTLPVSAASKVSNLKQLLASHPAVLALAAAASPSASPGHLIGGGGAGSGCGGGGAAPLVVDPRRLRLRDKKVAAVGSILRDGATVRRSLVGITDGRQVAVTLLDVPETVGPDDLVVTARGLKTSTSKFAGPSVELVVPKAANLRDLRALLAAHFGQALYTAVAPSSSGDNSDLASGGPTADGVAASEGVVFTDGAASAGDAAALSQGASASGGATPPLTGPPTGSPTGSAATVDSGDALCDSLEVAKGFPNGPPLKASAATFAGLKWEDPKAFGAPSHDSCDPAASPVSRPPLSLRDGSLLFVRSRNDATNAAAAAAAASAACAAGGVGPPGGPKTRSKLPLRAWASSGASSASSSSSSGRKEVALKIGGVAGGSSGGGKEGVGRAALPPAAAPATPRRRLASSLRVPYESACVAFEAAGGDEALARSFLVGELG